MATKSFLKTVNLQGRKECQDFIRAVERSQSSSAISGPRMDEFHARDLTPEQIKKVFCDSKTIEEIS